MAFVVNGSDRNQLNAAEHNGRTMIRAQNGMACFLGPTNDDAAIKAKRVANELERDGRTMEITPARPLPVHQSIPSVALSLN